MPEMSNTLRLVRTGQSATYTGARHRHKRPQDTRARYRISRCECVQNLLHNTKRYKEEMPRRLDDKRVYLKETHRQPSQ